MSEVSNMGGISLTEAQNILANEFAPWVQALGLEITEADKDGCTAVMPVAEHLFRHGGIVSGQAMMALADTAMVIAFSSFFGEFRPIATIDMATSFLRPASEDITVRASVVKPGRSLCFGEALLHSGDKLVCKATGTYMLPPARQA
jgi:uncharacterized protein (TIGR00369 family)